MSPLPPTAFSKQLAITHRQNAFLVRPSAAICLGNGGSFAERQLVTYKPRFIGNEAGQSIPLQVFDTVEDMFRLYGQQFPTTRVVTCKWRLLINPFWAERKYSDCTHPLFRSIAYATNGVDVASIAGDSEHSLFSLWTKGTHWMAACNDDLPDFMDWRGRLSYKQSSLDFTATSAREAGVDSASTAKAKAASILDGVDFDLSFF